MNINFLCLGKKLCEDLWRYLVISWREWLICSPPYYAYDSSFPHKWLNDYHKQILELLFFIYLTMLPSTCTHVLKWKKRSQNPTKEFVKSQVFGCYLTGMTYLFPLTMPMTLHYSLLLHVCLFLLTFQWFRGYKYHIYIFMCLYRLHLYMFIPVLNFEPCCTYYIF